MTGFVDRARDWRRRAEELRCVAEGTMTEAARKSLLDRAAALEHHAANIEQVTAKFRKIRQTAATTRLSRDFIPRRPKLARQQGDDD